LLQGALKLFAPIPSVQGVLIEEHAIGPEESGEIVAQRNRRSLCIRLSVTDEDTRSALLFPGNDCRLPAGIPASDQAPPNALLATPPRRQPGFYGLPSAVDTKNAVLLASIEVTGAVRPDAAKPHAR
jgi:hypothetical protein